MRKTTVLKSSIAGIELRFKSTCSELLTALADLLPPSTNSGHETFDIEISPDSDVCTAPPEKHLEGFGLYAGYILTDENRGSVFMNGNSDPEICLNAVRQIVSRIIFDRNGIILHASCVVRNGMAHLFAGRSGAGKSTVCELSPDDSWIASDDLTAVRKVNSTFYAYGLPTPAAEMDRSSTGCTVAAMFRLIQHSSNKLVPIKPASAAAGMLALPSQLSSDNKLSNILELTAELTDHIPAYELHFKKDPSFWELINDELNTN